MSKLTTLDQLQMLAQKANTKINAVAATIPTKVSQLTNDSKYQTDVEVATSIASVDGLKRKKVASVGEINVSAEGADKFIYLVPKTTSGVNDFFDEYMVIDGQLEYVGNTRVDMTGYLTTDNVASDEEVSTAIDAIFVS